MKKRILAVCLAFLFIFGAAVPVFADLRDEAALFTGLLSGEAAAEVEAVGEGFVDALMAWLAAYSEESGIPLNELIAEVAYTLNIIPQDVTEIARQLKWQGFWRQPTPFDAFTFGMDITREDIADVFEAVAAYYLEGGFDFRALLQAAGLSDGQFIEMAYTVIGIPGEREWLYGRHGEFWLVEQVLVMVREMELFMRFDEDDLAVLRLRLYWATSEMLRTLGYDVSEEIFSQMDVLVWFFDEEEVFSAIANNPGYGEAIAHLALYSEAELIDIFGFDWFDALEAFVDGEDVPQGFVYLDRLLGGFMAENKETLEQMIEYERGWSRMEAYLDEWWRLEGLHLPTETVFVEDYHLEQRLTERITQNASRRFHFEPNSHRLNIHFANRGDSPATVIYFIYDGWNYIRMRELELGAGGRFSVQVNFADLPFAMNWGDLSVFFLSPDGGPIDVHFAYRLTAFPRGHYTHGSR